MPPSTKLPKKRLELDCGSSDMDKVIHSTQQFLGDYVTELEDLLAEAEEKIAEYEALNVAREEGELPPEMNYEQVIMEKDEEIENMRNEIATLIIKFNEEKLNEEGELPANPTADYAQLIVEKDEEIENMRTEIAKRILKCNEQKQENQHLRRVIQDLTSERIEAAGYARQIVEKDEEIELIRNELQQLETKFLSLKQHHDSKTRENGRLREENEALQKKLADLAPKVIAPAVETPVEKRQLRPRITGPRNNSKREQNPPPKSVEKSSSERRGEEKDAGHRGARKRHAAVEVEDEESDEDENVTPREERRGRPLNWEEAVAHAKQFRDSNTFRNDSMQTLKVIPFFFNPTNRHFQIPQIVDEMPNNFVNGGHVINGKKHFLPASLFRQLVKEQKAQEKLGMIRIRQPETRRERRE